MFPFVGVFGLARRFVQHRTPDHLHVQALGKGSLAEGVGGVIHLGSHMGVDHRIDHLPVGQRAVASEPHHVVGGPEGLQRAAIAVQHVVERSAEDQDAGAGQDVREYVVGAVVAGRHHQPVDSPAAPQPLDLAQDHRRAGQGPKHLARQPRGRHARLEDGENQGRAPGESARG